MPYLDDQWIVTAEGSLPGGETWMNTWGIEATDPGADVFDAFASFIGFYTAIVSMLSVEWTLENVKARNLVTEQVLESPVSPALDGTGTGDVLPNQVAARASLKAVPNVNGGPFIAGINGAALAETGGVLSAASVALLADEVQDLAENLIAQDWRLVIIRPTVTDIAVPTTVRVGERLDVIRKRANEQFESYATRSINA